MAKGKQSSGKHYTSKGVVGVNRSISKEVRRDRPVVDKETNKFNAFLKGKNVWFTIANPNVKQTNQKFIRVRGRELYGDPKDYTSFSVKKS